MQIDGAEIPIEVKGGNAKAASLTALQGKWPEIRQAYKFMDGNVGDGENGISIAVAVYGDVSLNHYSSLSPLYRSSESQQT